MFLIDKDMKNLLSTSFDDAFFNYSDFFNLGYGYNAYKEDETTVIEINAAGFTRDMISVNLDGQQLSIKGDKSKLEDKKYLKKGLSDKFSYYFRVDYAKVNVDAVLVDGILTIKIAPIKLSKEAKQIEIK